MMIHSMGTAKCFGQNIEDSAPSVVCCGRTIGQIPCALAPGWPCLGPRGQPMSRCAWTSKAPAAQLKQQVLLVCESAGFV